MAYKLNSYRLIPKKQSPEKIHSYADLRKMNEELEKQAETHKGKIAKYKEEIEDLLKQKKELNEKLKLTRYEVDDLKEENVALRRENKKLRDAAKE
ncbi:MAG: hypothetical protein IT233_07335 [Bacteroidia bacterium]|nr:hypothetical protein [Bacteroidia bacterium]